MAPTSDLGSGMLKGVNIEEITDELAELIQDAGLTEGRLMRFGRKIMDALGESDPASAKSALVELANRMGDDKYHQALRNALGIGAGEKPSLLSERRQSLIESDDFPSVAIDTLRRWEKSSFEHFAGLILDHSKRQGDSAQVDVDQKIELLEDLLESTRQIAALKDKVIQNLERQVDNLSAQIENREMVIASLKIMVGEVAKLVLSPRPEAGRTIRSLTPRFKAMGIDLDLPLDTD